MGDCRFWATEFIRTDALGQFEQLVLTTVLLCGEKAYGMAVHEKVEELGERRVNSYSTFVPHPVSSTNLWDIFLRPKWATD